MSLEFITFKEYAEKKLLENISVDDFLSKEEYSLSRKIMKLNYNSQYGEIEKMCVWKYEHNCNKVGEHCKKYKSVGEVYG